MSKGVQIAIGATVIAALLGWYGATNLDANASFTYYQNLEDFHDHAIRAIHDLDLVGCFEDRTLHWLKARLIRSKT